MEVIDILCNDRGHPSAGIIFHKAKKNIPAISMSTVYYTLNLLKEEGLIKELEFYELENRYESDLSDHLDLICTSCGKIENYNMEIPLSNALIEDLTGFKAHKMRFEYYGVCRECKGNLT